MAVIFVAEVIDDGMAYGADAGGRIQAALSALSSGGEPIPIGTIEWRTGGDATYGSQTGFAAPLLPAFGQIPLVGEYVLCISAPSTSNTSATAAESFYYLGPLNIDGKRNHNISGGLFKRSTQPVVSLPDLPESFAKKTSPYLQPLIGDTIIQDRNGSSIRMSSTQLATAFSGAGLSGDQTSQFTWRTPGSNRSNSLPMYQPQAAGNPIMVISVGNPGQASTSIAGRLGSFGKSLTMVENVVADMSTIIMTSDQPLQYTHTRQFNSAKQALRGSADGVAKPVKKRDQMKSGDSGLLNTTSNPTPTYTNSSQVSALNAYKGIMENPQHGADFIVGVAYPAPAGVGSGGVAGAAESAGANSQIFMRAHRLVFDAQFDSMLISAQKDLKISTQNWRTDHDAVMSLNHELYRQVFQLSEHCVELSDKLYQLIEIVQKIQFPTGVGPTGPCLQVYDDELKALKDTIFESKGAAKPADSAKHTANKFANRGATVSMLWSDYEQQRRMKDDKNPETASK